MNVAHLNEKKPPWRPGSRFTLVVWASFFFLAFTTWRRKQNDRGIKNPKRDFSNGHAWHVALIDCLIAWLIGWLAGWVVGWLVDRMEGWMDGCCWCCCCCCFLVAMARKSILSTVHPFMAQFVGPKTWGEILGRWKINISLGLSPLPRMPVTTRIITFFNRESL